MTSRWPLLWAISLIAGAAGVTDLHGQRPTLSSQAVTADSAHVASRPSLAPPDAATSSTWYCAAGAATVHSTDPGTQAARDATPVAHTVVVSNTTDHVVDGLATVYSGRILPPSTDSAALADPAALPATTSATSEADDGPPVEPVEHSFRLEPQGHTTVNLRDLQPGPVTAAVVETSSGGVVVEQQLAGAHGSDVAACATATADDWHLAWGATTRDARELLVLFNPFPNDVTIDGVFSTEDGVREPLRWQGLAVPAGSVVAVDVGEDVTRRQLVAGTLRSRTGALVVARVQAFDGSAGPNGMALSLAQPAADDGWAFVDPPSVGVPGEQVAVYNPSESSATVEIDLTGVTPDPATGPQSLQVTVGPGRTQTVDLAGLRAANGGQPRLTVVRSIDDVPVVVERMLGFQPPVVSSVSGELSAGTGSPALATRWAFPTVAAGDGLSTRYVVSNPSAVQRGWVSLLVDGRPAPQAGAAGGTRVVLHPGDRVELDLPADVVATAEQATAVLEATVPVVAERVMLRDGHPRSVTLGIPFG